MEHEKAGAESWQTLPGYGLQSGSTTSDSETEPESTPQDTIVLPPTKPAVPSSSLPPRPKGNPRLVEGRARYPLAPSHSVRSPVTIRARIPYVPSQKGGSEVLVGKRRWLSGVRADAILRLPAVLFKKNPNSKENPAADRTKSLTFARDVQKRLDLVSARTGAFIKKFDPGDRQLQIWGDPKQVLEARDILLALLEEVFGPKALSGPGQWSKVHPQYAADIEQDGVEKAIKKAEFALRQEPADKDAYPNEMLFAWPRGGPSPRKCLGNQLEKLDPIRKAFKVYVFLKWNLEDFICIRGKEDIDLAQIAAQLRERWKAAVVESDIQIKAYLVEPLPVETEQDQVMLFKHNDFSLPILQGAPAITSHAHPKTADSDMEVESIRMENDQELLLSFQKALSKAHFFAGLLRMCIHFGTFVIYHRKADDGYSLQEFRKMMMLRRVNARLLPGLKLAGEDLISRCMGAGELFAPMDASWPLSEIKTMTPTYAACFEFSGKVESQFRLEVNFRQRALEIEQGHHRWFKTHRGDSDQTNRLPLQVAVVDFLRSDWQADIEMFEPVHGSQIRADLAQFQRTIRFDDRIRVHSMTAVPRRKVLFDHSVATIASFTEKASIQLRVRNNNKDTNYVLELARFDRYTRSRSTWSQVPLVSWGATLFDPKWDTMLGGGLGGDSSKKGKVTARFQTLFPSRQNDEHREQGFWEFFKLVDNISKVLGASELGSEELSAASQSRVATDLFDAELGMLF